MGPFVKIPNGGDGAHCKGKKNQKKVQQVESRLKENVKLSDFCMETNFKSILFELLAIQTFYQAFLLNM